jgi:hypothetical protein
MAMPMQKIGIAACGHTEPRLLAGHFAGDKSDHDVGATHAPARHHSRSDDFRNRFVGNVA